MTKGRKFVVGCCITMGIGVLLCAAGFAMGGSVTGINAGPAGIAVYTPDGSENRTKITYQTGEEQLEKFDGIKIEADYADVTIQPAEHYGISYHIDERYTFSYEIKDGTLAVTQKMPSGISSDFTLVSFGDVSSENEYYEHEFITVYVPKDSELKAVDVNGDSGEVICGNFYAEQLNIEAGYGDVELNEVGSKNASIIMDFGDLEISSFADGDITVENDYGNVVLEDVRAGEVNLKVDSGNLKVSEITADIFKADDNYGDITLQQVEINGINLTADSGNISLEDVKAGDFVVYSVYGNVEGKNIKASSFSGELESGNCKMTELDVKSVDVKSDYGDVKLGLTAKLTDYGYALETEYGEIALDGKDMGETYASLEDEKEKIAVFCESGNIQIEGVK